MSKTFNEIQNQKISTFDEKKLCSFDVEIISQPTTPLIHQTARFWFFKKGEGKISINNNTYDIYDNALVLIFPWDITDIIEVKEPFHLEKIVFNIDYVNNYGLKSVSNDIFTFKLLDSPTVQLNAQQAKEITGIVKNIKEEIGVDSLYKSISNNVLSNTYITLKIYELFILFTRYKNVVNTIVREDKQNTKKDDILKYIYAHVSDVTLTQLAEVFYMSESAISKYISSQTGNSFSEIVRQMKINKTIELLIHTNLSMYEIAEIVGFSDAQHMIQTFEKQKGITPKKYRQLYQSNNSEYKRKETNVAYEIIQYMEKHYGEEINDIKIAKLYNISTQTVNSALLALSERNFDDLLNYIRINNACVMLLQTNTPIIDISEDVGYNSVKTFNRYFYKYKKMLPSEFRKSILLQKGSETIPKYE